MDLTQKKLTKAEWESIEVPVSENEKKILQIIMEGYDSINIRFNENQTMIQHLNLHSISLNEIHAYLYKEYFMGEIVKIMENIQKNKNIKKNKDDDELSLKIKEWLNQTKVDNWIKKMKKADLIRIQHMSDTIHKKKPLIFEFLLLEFCEKIILSILQKNTDYGFYLYTLYQFKQLSIQPINTFVTDFASFVMDYAGKRTNIKEVFHQSPEFIEKNKYLLKYEDVTLFAHQKQLFSLFQGSLAPKLVLYTAPTGTGKTLSPIGLSKKLRIIFVCVARHVGLALAKSAISVGKKVAFAFGCETASDIRLHYFSAVEYSIHRKSGGIFKVDNSVGTNVEIIICDVKSYLTAMHYMLAFNPEEDIVTYWDEPTITMDYEQHELHEVIHKNWTENMISKVVLSCATLPKEAEIVDTLMDFKSKFEHASVHTITSFDCKKSISLLNKQGKCSLPHLLFSDYEELMDCIHYCEENKSLLRYFDLEEIIRFIEYVDTHDYIDDKYKIEHYFGSTMDITMVSIKQYYIETMKNLKQPVWALIHPYLVETQRSKFDKSMMEEDAGLRKLKSVDSVKPPPSSIFRTTSVSLAPPHPQSGILLTTKDAHTLTDGPTIYLAENVEKIGQFYIQETKIPEVILKDIMEKIGHNEVFQRKITILEKTLEDKLGKEMEKENKMEKENYSRETKEIMNQLTALYANIQPVSMDSRYIPNMKQHQMLWVPGGKIVENAFVPNIEEPLVKEIMSVDVDNQMKLLLLLGIGVFVNQPNIRYMEIMKRLATEQKLYIIIAQSDYIYGTNYQFCHGFIGKDLINMTHQKTIQALGRIGRNHIQHEYTVRFRDEQVIRGLFYKPESEENVEAKNMSRLFNTV